MSTTDLSPEQREHLIRIATPISLGLSLDRQALGYDMQVKPHHEYLEDIVLDAILDPNQRFIAISVGPRHGKTELLGKLLPLWFLGQFPDRQVIYASYAEDRSKSIGRWVRDIMRKYGPDLFGYGVSADAASATDWQVEGHVGKMLSVGRGGPILGEPGHLIVADDLVKGEQEADSASIRKTVKSWFSGTLRSRLEPGGTMILFFQRWRLDDLIGELKAECAKEGYTGDPWEFYNLPSLAEPTEEEDVDLEDEEALEAWRDPLGRKYGEALWPERYPAELLWRLRGNDETTFLCIHQGDPRPGKGGWFPRTAWKRYAPGEVPPMVKTVRIWDLAATKDGGDYTVGIKCGRCAQGDLWVLDVWRDRKEAGEVQRNVRSNAQADGNHVKIMIEQEKAGSGKTVVDMYKRYLAGFTVEPAKPDGSKEERAKPANEFQQLGRCHIPRDGDTDWVGQFVQELERFKRQKRDDQVDGFAYAFRELVAMGEPTEVWFPQVTLPMTHGEALDRMAAIGAASGVWGDVIVDAGPAA